MSILVRVCCWLGLAVSLGSLAGCGAGEYKQRVDASAARLKTGSAFKSLGPPVVLGDTRVTVRIPTIFQPCQDASRIAVPGLEKLTDKAAFGYEAMLPLGDDEAAGKVACSLRFWVRSGQDADYSIFLGNWLKQTFPATAEEPKDVTLRTDRGEESSWTVAGGERPQAFLCSVGGQDVLQEIDARVVAYWRKSPDGATHVLMTVRAPKGVWERCDLKKLSDQTAGCLSITPAAPQ